MKAVVNKIIPFSSVDGPGNRTAVFLQGCNINCKYCHNPETRKLCACCGLCVDNCPAEALSFIRAPGSAEALSLIRESGPAEAPSLIRESGPAEAPSLIHESVPAGDSTGAVRSKGSAETSAEERQLCQANRALRMDMETGAEGRPVIHWDAKRCVQCDTCIHVCPHDSSPRTVEMTPEEVYERVRRQIPFIRGLTVSGGECMLEPDFLEALFRLAKKDGLSAMIDSNGTIPFREHPSLIEVTYGVMLDIKAFFPEDHRRVTDADNRTVLDNAIWLAEQGKLYEVRCVIVPGLYDAEKNLKAMGAFLAPSLKESSFRIKLIAYRPMGVRAEYSHYPVPKRAYMEDLAGIVRGAGFKNIVIT